MKRTILVPLAVTLLCSFSVLAQSDLEKELQKISGSAGRAYVAPVVNGFGMNFNGGWFHGAPKASLFGIDIELGVVAMGTRFKDEEKTFTTSGSFRFSQNEATEIVNQYPNLPANARPQIIQQIISKEYTVSISGPTVIGTAYNPSRPTRSNQVYVTFPGDKFTVNGTTYTLDAYEQGQGIGGIEDLQDMSMLPLAAPQLTIGTLYGTQATLRYLPAMKLADAVGKVKYFGFGIQHNPGIWFTTMLPVDLSLSFFSQKMTIEPYMEATGTGYGLTASRKFGLGLLSVTPYAGFTIEKSNMKFTYKQEGTFVVDGVTVNNLPIEFETEGENSARFTLGASLRLFFLNINADYNMGKYNSFTGGVMFIF